MDELTSRISEYLTEYETSRKDEVKRGPRGLYVYVKCCAKKANVCGQCFLKIVSPIDHM